MKKPPKSTKPRAPTSKKGTYKSPVVQAEVMGLAMIGSSRREISRKTGLARETVARILSQEEYAVLVTEYRSALMERMPKILKAFDALIRKQNPQSVMQALFGLKILQQHHEFEVMPKTAERDYSSAMVKYHYLYGKWPTLEEAKEFDKTIKVELLTKKSTKQRLDN